MPPHFTVVTRKIILPCKLLTMRLSLLGSLVLSTAVSAESLPSLTEGIQSFLFNSIQTYRNGDIADAVPLRRLSTDTSKGGFAGMCNTDGSVNFTDDNFNMLAFGSQYDSMCTCNGTDNSQTIQNTIANLVGSGVTDFQALANALDAAIGNLSGNLQFDCTNGCEACYNNTCGILETSEHSSFTSINPNFTIADLNSSSFFNNTDFTKYIGTSYYNFSTCVSFTQTESGKLCYGANLEIKSVTDLNASAPCFITYNDQMCKSCEVAAGGQGCITADCTNIHSGANIDTCAKTGFVGPFIFIGVFERKNTISLGKCGVSVPASAPVGGGGGSPTSPTGSHSAQTSRASSVTKGLCSTFVLAVILFASHM